jgi:hypothetical protein
MCVEHNTEVRSQNRCCSGKTISITYSECLFVALVIQYTKRMHRIIISGLSGCTVFSTLSQSARFSKKKKVIEYDMCVLIFRTTYVRNVSHVKNNSARYYHTCEYIFI